MPKLNRSSLNPRQRGRGRLTLWVTLLGAAIASKFFIVDGIVADLRNATSSNINDAAAHMQWVLCASIVLGLFMAIVTTRDGWHIFRGKQAPPTKLFSIEGTLSGQRIALQGILYMAAGMGLFACTFMAGWFIWLLESMKK